MNSNSNIPTKSELQRLQDFLTWAKENDIAITEFATGSVSISMVDMSLMEKDLDEPSVRNDGDGAEPSNMYEDMLRRRGLRTHA